MANNTLSVYVKSPLFEAVKEAHADGKINVNEVCSEALEAALRPKPDQPEPKSVEINEEQLRQAAIRLDTVEEAQEFVDQASAIEYEISYSNTLAEASAFLGLVTEQGAWPISVCPDPQGRFCILVAYPKVLAETS